MDYLAGIALYFVNEPMRGLAMALLFMAFAVIERRIAHRVPTVKPWIHLIPAAAWMLFTLNEQETRGSEVNLRLDLFFTFPVLALVSLVCLWAFVMNVRRSRASQADAGD